jgi:hypothetical protein
VDLSPLIFGNIGILTNLYSTLVFRANAQKCGGVHKNMIPNKINASIPKEPVEHTYPITGGKAPEAPPITIF